MSDVGPRDPGQRWPVEGGQQPEQDATPTVPAWSVAPEQFSPDADPASGQPGGPTAGQDRPWGSASVPGGQQGPWSAGAPVTPPVWPTAQPPRPVPQQPGPPPGPPPQARGPQPGPPPGPVVPQQSWPVTPTSAPPQRPVSGLPVSGQPVSAQPTSGQPTSGQPSWDSPQPWTADPSVPPLPGAQRPGPGGLPPLPGPAAAVPPQVQRPPVQYGAAPRPAAEAPAAWDATGLGGSEQAYQPRFPPTPPAPKRRGLLVGLLVGLVVTVLAAGAGFFSGRGFGDGPTTATTGTPGDGKPSASPTLGLFESTQTEINKTKFDGDLVPLAEPWLSSMGGCVANTEKDGPKLDASESKRVLCRYGGAYVHFVQYKAASDRDNARNYRQQMNLATDDLIKGAEQPSRKEGGVSKASGRYIEYAVKIEDGRALCGIWWDREGNAAMLVEAFCQETLGGKWEPLRDLWSRHS